MQSHCEIPLRELRTLSAPLQGRPDAHPQRHQRTLSVTYSVIYVGSLLCSSPSDTSEYSPLLYANEYLHAILLLHGTFIYMHDILYCDCRDCRIVCWLAIYVLQVTLVVLGRGPDPRDPDLLILRGGSYSELAARGRRERERRTCSSASLGHRSSEV